MVSLCSMAQYSFFSLHLSASHVCYKYNVQGFCLYLGAGKVEKCKYYIFLEVKVYLFFLNRGKLEHTLPLPQITQGNYMDQHILSAIEKSRPEKNTFMIMLSPLLGKYQKSTFNAPNGHYFHQEKNLPSVITPCSRLSLECQSASK